MTPAKESEMTNRMVMVAALLWSGVVAAAPALDTAQIEQLTGAKGKLDEKEGVFKVSVPRSDSRSSPPACT